LLVGEPFFELCVFILEDGGCSLTKNFTPGFGATRLIPPLKLCFRAFGLRRHLAACVGGPRMWVDGKMGRSIQFESQYVELWAI